MPDFYIIQFLIFSLIIKLWGKIVIFFNVVIRAQCTAYSKYLKTKYEKVAYVYS